LTDRRPPIADALLTAAERSGAVLATVSNLYGYGPVSRPMTENLPLAATGPKGRTRAQMWRDALAAHNAGSVRATEVRASDYVAPGSPSHLGDRVVPRLLAGKSVAMMKSVDTPHTWTAVNDVAYLLIAVATDERVDSAWHVPSNRPGPNARPWATCALPPESKRCRSENTRHCSCAQRAWVTH